MAQPLASRRRPIGASATTTTQSSIVCAAERHGHRLQLPPLTEVACLGISWAILLTLAAAAIATRTLPGPPLALSRSVLAGGLAAALGEALFINVEVAKVRLQQRSDSTLLKELRYILVGPPGSKKATDAARPSVRTPSLLSVASAPGIVAGVIRALLYHGLRLGLFPPLRRALEGMLVRSGSHGALGLGAKMLIGACCGALGAALCTPLDLVKTQLALRPDAHTNSLAALSGVAKEGAAGRRGVLSSIAGGASALWPRGAVAATAVRAAFGSGAQLAVYAEVKRHLSEPLGGAFAISCASVASAVAYTTAAAPADLVKTRLMAKPGGNDERYSGPWDCLCRSIRRDGISVLFRGWGGAFGRLLPVLLLVMPLVERFRALFGVGGF